MTLSAPQETMHALVLIMLGLSLALLFRLALAGPPRDLALVRVPSRSMLLVLAIIGLSLSGCEATNFDATGKCLGEKAGCDRCCKDNGASGKNDSASGCKCVGRK